MNFQFRKDVWNEIWSVFMVLHLFKSVFYQKQLFKEYQELTPIHLNIISLLYKLHNCAHFLFKV